MQFRKILHQWNFPAIRYVLLFSRQWCIRCYCSLMFCCIPSISLFFLLQAIFYADNSQHVITRVSLDGSGSEEVVLRGLGSVGGVVVDWVEGAVLYSDSTAGAIASMNIETMTTTTLLSSLSNPGALALHSDSSSRCTQHANITRCLQWVWASSLHPVPAYNCLVDM